MLCCWIGMGGRKGRDGLFPATSCIKIAGYYGLIAFYKLTSLGRMKSNCLFCICRWQSGNNNSARMCTRLGNIDYRYGNNTDESLWQILLRWKVSWVKNWISGFQAAIYSLQICPWLFTKLQWQWRL